MSVEYVWSALKSERVVWQKSMWNTICSLAQSGNLAGRTETFRKLGRKRVRESNSFADFLLSHSLVCHSLLPIYFYLSCQLASGSPKTSTLVRSLSHTCAIRFGQLACSSSENNSYKTSLMACVRRRMAVQQAANSAGRERARSSEAVFFFSFLFNFFFFFCRCRFFFSFIT